MDDMFYIIFDFASFCELVLRVLFEFVFDVLGLESRDIFGLVWYEVGFGEFGVDLEVLGLLLRKLGVLHFVNIILIIHAPNFRLGKENKEKVVLCISLKT